MEVITYIPDAPTLVDNISTIKQWVYSGYVRLLVPVSELNQVDEQYHESLLPKKPTEVEQARKSWGNKPRKEYPLFDINPRIAKEFLSRAQSENGVEGITFQKEEEKFTQWTQKEEVTGEKVELSSPPPTSFANALLRKLNMQDTTEVAGAKGANKTQVVARASDLKGAWASITGVEGGDSHQQRNSLISCVLWRIHEGSIKSSEPEEYALLADSNQIRKIASGLGITCHSFKEVRQTIKDFEQSRDHRDSVGGRELDFSSSTNGSTSMPATEANSSGATAQDANSNGQSASHITEQSALIPEPPASDMNKWKESFESKQNINHPREPLASGLFSFGSSPSSPQSFSTGHAHPDKLSALQAPIGTGRLRGFSRSPLQAVDRDVPKGSTSLLDSLMQGSSPDVPENMAMDRFEPQKSISPIGEAKAYESDLDSDEEVIVFKARRASGRPNTSSGPAKSRPTTSHGRTASNDALKPAKSPVFSSLKPQSPVFTPGRAYVSTLAAPEPAIHGTQATRSIQHNGVASPTGPAQDRNSSVTPPGANGSARSPLQRTPAPVLAPRRPRADLQSRHASMDLQQQSRMIIQRQREAIERQVKASTKPPPRQISLEPTENPTIIDPDAFDRSYVVQQSAQPPTPSNGHGRASSGGRGGRRRSPAKATESPKQQPKKVADKQTTSSADVDYVLKSGQPRSTRGKGRLFVP